MKKRKVAKLSNFEKEERTTTYDLKILKWLMSYLRPYRIFMILSLTFMICTALLEVLVPYLTKQAVDSYIYPPWRKTVPQLNSNGNKIIRDIGNKYSESIVELNDGTLLIDISKLGRSEKADLERTELVRDTKYIVVSPEELGKNEELGRIINENLRMFNEVKGYYYISFDNLREFSSSEISILRSEDIKNLKILVLYLFLSLLGIFTFTSLYTYILNYSGHRIMHSIRGDAFSHIMNLPQLFFDKNPVGRITTRITNDVNAINEVYTSVLIQFLKDMLVIAGVLVIMYSMNPALTFIILGLTVCLGIVATTFRMKLKTVFRNIRVSIGKLNAFVQESIHGILLIKLYGKEFQNYKRFTEVNRENLNANMSQLWTYATFRPFIEYVSITATALIIWYGGLQVINLSLTIGSLIAFLYYVRMLFKPILELAEKYNLFQSAAAASENLYDIIHEKPEESGDKNIKPGSARIEFRNVWFGYKENEWVLKDISFTIEPGQTVALVGLTGSGKTTIVNLLLKFYRIQHGEILFNGVNINEIDNNTLRKNITAVFQDLFLFGKDISDRHINSESVKRDFGLKNFGDSSKQLSSGENQILSLAKAFSKKSGLLIMDEATSLLDAEIEGKIQDIIRSSDTSQTKLIIAHRLSNVRDADKIIVIHKGEIAETGTHEGLLRNKGIYYTLHNFQKEVKKAS